MMDNLADSLLLCNVFSSPFWSSSRSGEGHFPCRARCLPSHIQAWWPLLFHDVKKPNLQGRPTPCSELLIHRLRRCSLVFLACYTALLPISSLYFTNNSRWFLVLVPKSGMRWSGHENFVAYNNLLLSLDISDIFGPFLHFY